MLWDDEVRTIGVCTHFGRRPNLPSHDAGVPLWLNFNFSSQPPPRRTSKFPAPSLLAAPQPRSPSRPPASHYLVPVSSPTMQSVALRHPAAGLPALSLPSWVLTTLWLPSAVPITLCRCDSSLLSSPSLLCAPPLVAAANLRYCQFTAPPLSAYDVASSIVGRLHYYAFCDARPDYYSTAHATALSIRR